MSEHLNNTDAEQRTPSLDVLLQRLSFLETSEDGNFDGKYSSHGIVKGMLHDEKGVHTFASDSSIAGRYPTSPNSYDLKEICGKGSSSTVRSVLIWRTEMVQTSQWRSLLIHCAGAPPCSVITS